VKLEQNLRNHLEHIVEGADVRINGNRPWDIVVHDERFYREVMSQGSLGLGESYMDGYWDCFDLAQLFSRLLQAHLDRTASLTWREAVGCLKAKLTNRQKKSESARNVHHHYDVGNDLYRNMLGRWMLYSSADWENAASLDQAGEAKLDFVCQKLNLQAGQKILDIGCGWGGFAKYAAQRYGLKVVGITLSTEQIEVARQICADLPVEIRYQDYRELDEKFDHVVSLGMFEHVGHKNYRQYMKIVRRCLKPHGLFFLNTIGASESGYSLNRWTDKYIFPGALLPAVAQIGAAIDGLFAMQELRNWAEYYDRTLIAWFDKFNLNWCKLKKNYNQRFYRMWKYYLLSSAGAFRAEAIQDWQIILSS